MKKFFVSTCFIVIFIVSIFYQRVTGMNTSSIVKDFSAIAQNTNGNLSNPGNGVSINNGSGTAVPPVEAAPAAAVKTVSVKTAPVPTPTPVPTPAPVPVPAPVVSQGKYRNGTYAGNSADASYGSVQVAAVIAGGKISDIKFLDYPSDRQHSLQLSSYALPILRQEAIAAQSENIDTISGASYTSAAFIESLSSALSQAM